MMAVGEFISYVGKECSINVMIFRHITLIIIYIMILCFMLTKRSFHYLKYIKRLFFCESCKPKCQERMIMHNFMCKYCLSIVEKLWISIFCQNATFPHCCPISHFFFVSFRINTQLLIIMQLIVIILSHKLLLSPKGGIPYIR